MYDAEAALSLDTLYQRGIPVQIADPEERAEYASRPFAFRAVNQSIMPENAEEKDSFLADLGQFLRTGDPGNFTVVEENLRDHYLVAIYAGYRISRKIFATHPLMPGRLLAIGGVGLVRPDEEDRRLTVQTPMPNMTLHRFFPDLPKISMSAGYPTPEKTIESRPNVDPLGGYSQRVAEIKYRNAAMIASGEMGVNPLKFPVVTNVAWGMIGEDVAFYVYALPENAVPVTELLHGQTVAEIQQSLSRYMLTGKKLLQALRHLHDAGYVFNQAHQGNVYYYQDAQGGDQIVIADLDTIQSIQEFSTRVPEGRYLSPKAFATMVNLQVASANVAHIAWIDFIAGKIRELKISDFPGLEDTYVSIIYDLLRSYVRIPENARREEVRISLREYYRALMRQGMNAKDRTKGAIRLLRSDLYEADLFGFIFTYTLMDTEYCERLGARHLMEGISRQSLEQTARAALSQAKGSVSKEAISRALNQQTSQIISERSNQAMQELIEAYRKKLEKEKGA